MDEGSTSEPPESRHPKGVGPCEHSLHWGQLGSPAPPPIPAQDSSFYRCWVFCSSVLRLLWELFPLFTNKMKTHKSSYCVFGCWDWRHPQLLGSSCAQNAAELLLYQKYLAQKGQSTCMQLPSISTFLLTFNSPSLRSHTRLNSGNWIHSAVLCVHVVIQSYTLLHCWVKMLFLFRQGALKEKSRSCTALLLPIRKKKAERTFNSSRSLSW